MRKPKPPRLVTVFIFTTITLIFWIFFSLYNILTKPTSLDIEPKILEPISPDLDTKSLQALTEKLYFEEGQVVIPINPTAQQQEPKITETPTPEETLPEETPTPEIVGETSNPFP